MSADLKPLGVAGRARTSLLGACAASVVALAAGDASAQSSIPPPETYNPVDANGVNLFTGGIQGPKHSVSIGQPGQGGLGVELWYDSSAGTGIWRHSLVGTLNRDPLIPGSSGYDTPQYQLTLPGFSALYLQDVNDDFILIDGTGTLDTADGDIFTYTALDGTVATIDRTKRTLYPYLAFMGQVTTIARPNGEVITYHYAQVETGEPLPMYARRLQSVTNNFGYQIHFQYASDTYGPDWTTLTKIVGVNNAVDWCDPVANVCGFSRTWPSLTIGGTSTDRTVTDATGNATHYLFSNSLLTGIRRPTQSTGASLSYTRHTNPYWPNYVATASDGVGTWSYAYTSPPPNPNYYPYYSTTTTVTDPMSGVTKIEVGSWHEDPWGRRTQRLVSVTNGENEKTEWVWDEPGWQVHSIIQPEGNRLTYGYTARGDLQSVTRMPKPGSGLSPTTISAVFADCSTPILCGRPTSVTDARGNVTNYTYAAHGGVLTETRPADPNGVRPQTRYAYQSLQAWRRTSSSPTQAAAPSVILPVQTSACATGTAPSCVGTAQEVRTTTTHQAGNASTGSNLLPVTITSGAGDGSLVAITTTSWDPNGDRKTVDGPLAGTTDTIWYGYDAMRRNVGVIAPDPDGSGPLPFPATRTVFNADGQAAEVERGSAAAQSDNALSTMSVLREVVSTYDLQTRKTADTQVVGTSAIAITQYSYDNEGRLRCTALRMNPLVYGSLPSDACSQSTAGAYGQDRIVRNTYDAADRLTQVEMGVGTAVAQTALLQAWTPNGKVDWVQDANHNRSNYVYDEFDRLERLEFPAPTLGSQAANPADYEQYSYDAASNLTSRRLRDGQTLTFAYDALNRETAKTVPGLGTADDVFTTYDLLDRRLAATFVAPGSMANGIAWTWDALGRPLTETAYGRTLTSTFDLAGRRTRLTWPSPFSGYVDFGWDLAGRMTTAVEGPATGAAATYTYDALGRRTSLSRTGAATTGWSYVPNSRGWSMTHDLAGGTTNDVTYAFAFNPAGQAVSRDVSNPAYEFALPTQSATPYVRDGLNQYDSVNGVAFAHDARGNLTSDGVRVYGYDVENRLVSVYQGGVLQVDVAYDPLGRIKRTSTPTVTEQYLWDGDRLVGTVDSSNVPTGRWLHGPGPDEPLAQLLSPRRWLLADQQGSITAETDATGALVGAPYTYDPYGRPDSSHGFAGPRFRYTGQTALVPAVPLWHYRARIYDPGIGRFLQTDPIGYDDSLNLYQYVGNDPLNWRDPSGLRAENSDSSRSSDPCLFDFFFLCPKEDDAEDGDDFKNPWKRAFETLVDGSPGCASGGIANCFGQSAYVTTYQFVDVTGVAIVGGGGSGGTYQVVDIYTGEIVDTGKFVAATASLGFDVKIVAGAAVVDGAPSDGLKFNVEGSFANVNVSNNGSGVESTAGFEPWPAAVQVGISVTRHISDNGRVW